MSKESHQFSTDAAKKVGVNAAIIFGHLIFLHKANLNRADSWDGFRYWIKKTARAFEAMYPYLSQKEIRGALDRLQKDGYILSVAGLSENKFDRAKSFSIEKSGFDLYEIEEQERHVFTCDKRANGRLPKGKSDVTQRANQMLPKGQMLNSYNSYNDCKKDMSGVPDAVPDKHITDALKEQLDALVEEHKTATPERREEIVRLGKKTKQRYELELKIDQTILHLNKKTGFRYKLSTLEARRVIEKRLAKNTIEEMFQVIDYKSDEWKDNIKMRGNLVPATLFNGHFEDYYQASLLKPKKKNENEAVYTPPVKRFAQ